MSNEPDPSPVHDAPQRETFDLPEVAARLGVSRTSIYRWAASGVIPTIRLGHRRLVPRAVVERLLDPHSSTQTSETPDSQSAEG